MRNVGTETNVQTGSGAAGIGGGGDSGQINVKKDEKPTVLKTSSDVYVGPHSTPPPAPAAIEYQTVDTPAGEKNAVTMKGDRAILLFNGDCPVCKKIASWVIAADDPANGGEQKLDERPIGFDPEALKKLNPNLSIWDAYATIHVIMPDGSMKVGGEAIAEVLRRLPETSWFSGLFDLGVGGFRPFQSMLNGAYYVLDKLRPALGCKSCGTPTPWWGKPIEWAVNGWKWLFGSKSEEPPPPPSTPPAGNG